MGSMLPYIAYMNPMGFLHTCSVFFPVAFWTHCKMRHLCLRLCHSLITITPWGEPSGFISNRARLDKPTFLGWIISSIAKNPYFLKFQWGLNVNWILVDSQGGCWNLEAFRFLVPEMMCVRHRAIFAYQSDKSPVISQGSVSFQQM